MTNLADIRSAIVAGTFTNADLNSISDAITFARSQMAKQKVKAFKSGSVVKFTSNRNGVQYNGVVEKVGIKNIVVRTPMGMYRVPANMLEFA